MSFFTSALDRVANQKLISTQLPNLLLSSVSIFRKPLQLPSRPAYIQVEPSIRCNLRCKMCNLTRVNSKRLDMSLDQFRNILDQFPNVVQIHLQGLGEPLMNSDFFRMVIEAKKKGIYVSTSTNAILISEKIAKKIVTCGLDQMWFSLDGATSETYEYMRVGASFHKVKENIKRVVAQSKDSRIRLGIWFVAMKRNIHELPLLPKLATELEIQNMRVELIDTWGKSVLKDFRDLLLTSKYDLARLVDFSNTAERIARSRKLELEFNPRMKSVINRSRLPGCWAPWLSAYITVEGFITPCGRRPDPGIFSYGNLFKERFLDIWNNSLYQTFRYGLTVGKVPAICNDCSFAYSTSSVSFLKYLATFLKV